MVRLMIILLAAFAFSVGQATAWGGSDGTGNSSLCCKIPKSLETDAQFLRFDFAERSFQELLDQQLLKMLCKRNSCGRISEAQASRLLDRIISHKKDVSIEQDRLETMWTTRIGLGVAAFGLLISWLAYRQSRDADRRSVKNEVEIEHLKILDT